MTNIVIKKLSKFTQYCVYRIKRDLLRMKPKEYVPDIVKNRYVDHYFPSSKYFNNLYPVGVICPCSVNLYKNRSSMVAHCKSESHTLWLDGLSKNLDNDTDEMSDLQSVILSQQIIITNLTNHIEHLSQVN